MNEKNNKQIDLLVDELDKLFADGIGHVDVNFERNTETPHSIKHFNECAEGKGACGIPTELLDSEITN